MLDNTGNELGVRRGVETAFESEYEVVGVDHVHHLIRECHK